MRSLEDEVRSIADHYPISHIDMLAAALEPVESSQYAGSVPSVAPTPLMRQQVIDLIGAWKQRPSVTGAGLALALRAAGATARAIRGEMAVEPVWTGPETPEMSVRLTRAALLEVIALAKTRILLVSYAAYKVDTLVSAIADACERDVDVRFVLETSELSGGALSFDAAHAFSALGGMAKFYVWSAHRPAGAKLHAKAAIADEAIALVTSANLTGAALDDNMELGLLVRGGGVPRRLSRHFLTLMDEEILTRVS